MVKLYGKVSTRADLHQRSGTLAQFGGVRLVTLDNGVERGIRMLQFTTGSGLYFSVLVDRAMDIAEVWHNGRSVGWQSPTGFRNPGLHEVDAEDGWSWTRSFSGFLSTCGLDHILGPETVSAENYNYPTRKTIAHGLHGRVGSIPAKLTGYGEHWDGDRCILWAEGVIVQAAVFGEVLHLKRRIEVDLGGNEIRLNDTVSNEGYAPTPHMFFYHINIGYPMIDEGSRLLAPINKPLWASHEERGLARQNVGYRTCPAPQTNFMEQVWQHDTVADANDSVPIAVINDKLKFGIAIQTQKSQLPCVYQWQNFQAGHYVMAVEPSTHHVKGNKFARDRGEMIWLKQGETRSYVASFKILDGADDLNAAEAMITAIATQPVEDYPPPTNIFPQLRHHLEYGLTNTCQFDFTGKNVLVIGASRGGIGAAIARSFQDAGAKVVITGAEAQPAPEDQPRFPYHQLDVTDGEAIFNLAAKTPVLDILVNCAAITSRGEEMSPPFFEKVVNVNLHGTFRTAEAFYPHLKAQRGCLINIASMYAQFGSPRNPAYGASKAAVVQLTKSLAIAWAPDGIRVNAVAPGFIVTEQSAKSRTDANHVAAVNLRTPMARWGEPADIAAPVLFLASTAAGFMTGTCLAIDGGYSIA